MADNQKLQTVAEVNATMERFGVQSSLPSNKAMTVGEFSQLVSQIKIPLMSDELIQAFESFFGNSNKSYCLIVSDGDNSVPGLVDIQTDRRYEKDFQEVNSATLVTELTPKPYEISIDSESIWSCACLIARDGRIEMNEGNNNISMTLNNVAVFAIVYYYFK